MKCGGSVLSEGVLHKSPCLVMLFQLSPLTVAELQLQLQLELH